MLFLEPQMNSDETQMNASGDQITREIIGAAFEVHNTLGYGFLEKVYQKALAHELELRGLSFVLEPRLNVYFKDCLVGDYYADLLFEDRVMVEIKTAPDYRIEDEAQLLNELKSCKEISLGLLLNFGREKVQFKRMIFSDRSAFHPRSSEAT